MYALRIAPEANAAMFRDAAKRALAKGIAPKDIAFVHHDAGILFAEIPQTVDLPAMTVPREFADLLADVICHRAEDRFGLLYDVIWRLRHGEPQLLSRASDPVIARLSLYVKAVRRDIHKMHAFVRFHRKETEDGEVFVAWFEPDHFILKRATPFFAERFANMRWIIATPIGTASWDMAALGYGPPQPKPKALKDGVLDGLWRTYYRTIFNPARLNTDAMRKEMPRRYWRNMPETGLIPEMIETTQARVTAIDRDADQAPRFAGKLKPREKDTVKKDTLEKLKDEAAHCTACPLYRHATQTVFGEGPQQAAIMLVGEQPGDKEDLAAKPFVGPAGQLLDRALDEAGIARKKTYITNAVKHFKFTPRGKIRLHQKPNTAEIKACNPWLMRERTTLQPRLIVALGATAARGVFGRDMPIGNRGRLLELDDGTKALITVHPSYLLRVHDADREREYAHFVADLKLAAPFQSDLHKAA